MKPMFIRFITKVAHPDDSDCWKWTGTALPNGRGVLTDNHKKGRRTHYAYRVGYELMIGPIPDGLVLDHLCRNPNCVNPWHLEPVTQTVNVQRHTGTQTHCQEGHEYTEENTYRWRGRRKCRICQRRRQREYERRIREVL